MKELLILITLVLGVAFGFVGCGDDDEKTDTPVESSADAGVVESEPDAGGSDAAGGAGGAGGEVVDETDDGAGGEAGGEASDAAGGSEAE